MKVDITKSKIYSVLILLLFGLFFCSAQTISTNETKIVFILNQKTNTVSGITLLDIENSKNVLPNTYPNHIFYLGILKGSYKLSDNMVIPLTESTITIYTDKALFSEDQFSQLDQINFGSVKTKVISKKKGEIILKTL